jgi:outer membrane protein assembly factor BamA
MYQIQPQRAARAVSAYAFLTLLVASCSREVAAQATVEPEAVPQTQLPAAAAGPAQKRGLGYWFNPVTSPFLPLPEIAVDPNSGPTYGLLPVWLRTNANHDVTQIIAPDLIYNDYFGYGTHARLYVYPSLDEQWSVSAGFMERVERSFFGQFQRGRLRDTRWSTWISVVYDRDGTARFYGIGNDSPLSNQTNYTDQQAMLQGQFGLNLSHAWQIQYTARLRSVDVLPGTLPAIPSIEVLFPNIPGLGTTNAFLNRLAIVYDTRDDPVMPRRGAEWIAYGGLASRSGIFNDSLYSEAGVDGRTFWPIGRDTVLAAHGAVRYLPSVHDLPFWALSSLGGGQTEIGGAQPLRGFGAGRFTDRNSIAASVELRHRVFSIHVASTHVDIELTPFLDTGRVFSHGNPGPLSELHTVGGLGFRGVARPFVVGYVDVGYGGEGVAVFTGLNYPF